MDPEIRPPSCCMPPSYLVPRSLLTHEVRQLESAAEKIDFPALVLMEHAARGVAALAAHFLTTGRRSGAAGRTLVLAGPGNNGGDGYGAARQLATWGFPVRVWAPLPSAPTCLQAGLEATWAALACPVLTPRLGATEALEEALEDTTLVIDALFGCGLSRPLGPDWARSIERVNAWRALASHRIVLAVDLPSGLNADTGQALPVCVRADVTATMIAPKRGIVPGMPGAAWAGHVVSLDIGLPPHLLAPYRDG